MKLSVAISAVMAAAVTATPFPGAGTNVLANFDDLPSLPGVSELNPVGSYKGLKWNALDVLQAGIAGINAVRPQSGINVAANGITDALLQGGLSITADTVRSFDFQSLYFGCVINTGETLASAPQTCTVAFSGYKKGQSKPFRTVNQQFSPTNPLISRMTKASFNAFDFSELDRVDIAVVSGVTPAALTGLLIDNVQYRTYST